MTSSTWTNERDLEISQIRGALQRCIRTAVHARLARIRRGALILVDGEEVSRFGEPDPALQATVTVSDPRFYRSLVLRGVLGGAESYMDGMWRADDLTGVVRVLARNREAFDAFDRGWARLARPALRVLHALRDNTRRGSRRNIAAHYDLGNDFYGLFLDPTLTYSCGIFESEDSSMEEASLAKYERVCQKLELAPDDRVLEIGSGWGGFAIHAASRHGCHVTATTISRQQFELAQQRVVEAGVGDRVEVRYCDYRDLEGTFDKIVSIEMIEAVGHRHLETFFRACSERLRPDGRMLLQAIKVQDQDYERARRTVDFIKRYIFPGGQCPSTEAIVAAVARVSDFRLSHLEELTPHYAETLRRWRSRLVHNLDRIRELGLSERFVRMWEFYLCYCEGGFEERQIGVTQMLLEKPLSRCVPPLGKLT